ncbi:MAG: FxsA family protein [Lentisphaeria bacterium]|nr:FxsA family protein [Lentisphaeria bacterium]
MNIFLWLLALFVFFPAMELAIFVRLGSALGVLPTLLIILGTGMLGAYVARQQGLLAWRGVHEALSRGENPSLQVLDGLGILLAGIALIIPGFFSDCVGLLLLLRPVRLLFMSFLLGHVVARPGHSGHWQRRSAPRPGERRNFGAGAAGANAEPTGTVRDDHVPSASEMIIDVTPKDRRREP